MKGVFDKIKSRMDINEPQPRIKDLCMQWQKAWNEVNLDDFFNTGTGKKMCIKNMLSKSVPESSASLWLTLRRMDPTSSKSAQTT